MTKTSALTEVETQQLAKGQFMAVSSNTSKKQPEQELYYLCVPQKGQNSEYAVEFMSMQQLLQDEPACKKIWQLIDTQFNTRSKFLAIWRCVSYVAVHRNANGELDGFLLVSTPVNWQIDYVVVDPESRGQGIATKLVKHTLSEAAEHSVPYVMLTSKESLRGMYESFGFTVVAQKIS